MGVLSYLLPSDGCDRSKTLGILTALAAMGTGCAVAYYLQKKHKEATEAGNDENTEEIDSTMTQAYEGDAAKPAGSDGGGAASEAVEASKPHGESLANFQAEMARMQAAGNMGMGMGGGLKSLTPEECGGEMEKYKWLQSEQEIIVEFEVPKGTRGKQISVKWTSTSIKISALNDSIIDGKLLHPVKPDECMWEIDDVPGKGRKVTVTLHKAKPTLAMHHWNAVCEGEPTIDTKKFGPPIMGVNENDPHAMQRMMEQVGAMR